MVSQSLTSDVCKAIIRSKSSNVSMVQIVGEKVRALTASRSNDINAVVVRSIMEESVADG